MNEWLANPENLNLALGLSAALGAMGIKVLKVVIVSIFPAASPLLALFNPEQKQLAKVLDAAHGGLHKNEDLKQYALKKGLKLAASLMKK